MDLSPVFKLHYFYIIYVGKNFKTKYVNSYHCGAQKERSCFISSASLKDQASFHLEVTFGFGKKYTSPSSMFFANWLGEEAVRT